MAPLFRVALLSIFVANFTFVAPTNLRGRSNNNKDRRLSRDGKKGVFSIEAGGKCDGKIDGKKGLFKTDCEGGSRASFEVHSSADDTLRIELPTL